VDKSHGRAISKACQVLSAWNLELAMSENLNDQDLAACWSCEWQGM